MPGNLNWCLTSALSAWLITATGHFDLKAQTFSSGYERFDTENGLPHREVNAIHEDKRGFIWLGTPQGLSRFDGRRFQTFNARTDGFQHDNIWNILEDADGWFWLLPNAPFEDFDIWHPVRRERTTFRKKFGINPPNIGGLEEFHGSYSDSWVRSESDGTIFTFLNDSTLMSCHPNHGLKTVATEKLTNPFIIAAETLVWVLSGTNRLVCLTPSGKTVRSISSAKPIAFGAQDAPKPPFYFFDRDLSGTKKPYRMDASGQSQQLAQAYRHPVLLHGADKPHLGEDLILDHTAIFRTDGRQVLDLAAIRGTYAQIPENSERKIIRSLYFDRSGRLWMGGSFGLEMFSIQKNNFERYLWKPKDWESTRGIWADSNRILVNREAFGTCMINRKTGLVRDIFSFSAKFGFYAISPLRAGGFVVGHDQRLFFIHDDGNLIRDLYTGFPSWSLLQRPDGAIWIGSDTGIKVLDAQTGVIQPLHIPPAFRDLAEAAVMHIGADSAGRVWVCSNRGLFRANASGVIEAQYSTTGKGRFYLPHNTIHHFYDDGKGHLWLASGGGGLIRLAPNPADHKEGDVPARQWTLNDGLSHDVVYAVYPDHKGNLWLSSDKGIMRFNQETGEVKTYLERSGITHHEFNRIAHFQDNQGRLYFGGLNGVTAFHPDNLQNNQDSPDPLLAIAAFEQFDGKQGKAVDGTARLIASNTIRLQPSDHFFNLEVALLSFENVAQNRFAFRLEGLEEKWSYTNNPVLRFGRLPFGQYRLVVKGQDALGHWSEHQISLTVQVVKPFYLQSWFLLLVFSLLIAGTVGYIKIHTWQLRQRQRELEQLVAERTRKISEDKQTIEKQTEELRQLEKLKSRFFANVSHELRTPLTLMLGPVNNLLKRPDWKGKDRQMLALIQRNGAQLLKLVNEILDLSKLETGRIELNLKPVLLLDFFKPLVAQFSSFSDSERVDFQFDYRADKQLCILLDKDKFEKIVHNFLANALKFTPKDGKVALIVEEAGDELLVKVADTGPGIHPDDLPHIFDRFYQSKLPDVSGQGGTGIGLSLCKELAVLMDGSVWAESKYGFGSNFYLRMPMEKADPAGAQPMPDAPLPSEPGATPVTWDKDPAAVGHDKTHVLIVEDNADLRRLLQSYLEEKYRISTATNGREGLAALAAGLRPDIILSDVMMPVMDGIQMIERIKEQDALRHIPIIMLTARTDIKVKLKVLRLGVDDYLIKPFDEDELLARMDNLLRFSRARNLADFEDEPTDPYHAEIEDMQPENPPGVVLSTDDAHWLQMVEETTCEHLLHVNFNAELLASRLSLSTRQLQRRIRYCTGLSTNQYIQEARLQQARELLEGGKVLVKQAAAQVGFKDVKYFTGLYKSRFGKLPSDS
ncbi:MAG: response regulator [Saprospiraceae bacterium]